MSTDSTPSEIWNNILNGDVEKDDPLWKEYLDKAAVFDERMVDELNKIVDVLLVFVALFISILTSVILQTITQFHRNPADITNDLLVAIYNQLVAQSNNTSIPSVDPSSYFNQSKSDYNAAVIQNALLYTSLSLSIIVSVMGLLAKLWLVNYSTQVFSVGSPYDRAMKRQEAHNGALVWHMRGLINMLPFFLIVILYLFGYYVYTSIYAVQNNIGVVVEFLFCIGILTLGLTSHAAALVSGCPFRSGFSDVLQFSFESSQKLFERCRNISSKARRWLWIGTLAFVWIVSDAVVAYAALKFSKFIIAFSPIGIPVLYSAREEPVHKPQKYKISHMGAWSFLLITLTMILATCFDSLTFILLYIVGMLGVGFLCLVAGKMSKSMVDTGEIDAMAWLLITAPPQYPATLFKKAGQMTGFDSIGRHYRPRLLQSLMPLLTLLITSYHAPENHTHHTHSPSSKPIKIGLKGEKSGDVLNVLSTRPSVVDDDMGTIDEDLQLKNIEIYTACLARLSEFTDCEGSFWCLREDAMQHPKLEQPLVDKLVVFSNHFQGGLSSAATKILHNYKLDMDGNPARSAATSMININSRVSQEKKGRPKSYPATGVEPVHSSGEV